MSSVDDRIVNMQFNNKQFTQGAADSQKALQGLESTLAKTASSKGLTNLEGQVGGLSGKFSALQIAGVSAIATIASKATVAGMQLIKGMTLDPVMQGFKEYETNLNSIQTIMANTGKKVEVVNKYLGNLNEYSDRTIYNFSQMASSIGKFTAAGVELPAATDAIKGMANSAALGGADVHQLNSAMYQMSQALASGTIKLMDWNSLVNANMGGENMQESLKATAMALGDEGVAMQAAITKHGTFRDSLTEGWLSAEVFNKTMKIMAGTTNEAGDTVAYSVEQLKKMGYETKAAKELSRVSQAAIDSATKIKTFTQMIDVVKESIGSGWAQIFQNLFGNFNEASSMWTSVGGKITDTIGAIFDSVNGMLEVWREAGGYQDLWAGFGNIFQTLGNIMRPFVTLFQSLFPSSGSAGKGLANLTSGFESFTGMMERATSGLDILTPVLTKVGEGVRFIFSQLGFLVSIGGKALSFLGDLGAKGIEIADGILGGVLQGLNPARLMQAVTDLAHNIVDWIKDALGIHSPAAELVPVGRDIILGIVEGIKNSFSYVKDAVIRLGPQVLDAAKKALLGLADGLAGGFNTAVAAISRFLTGIMPTLKQVAGQVTDVLGNALSSAGDNAGAAWDKVGGIMSTVGGVIKDIFSALGGVASWVNGQFDDLFGGIDGLEWASLMNALFTGATIITIREFAKAFKDGIGGIGSSITDTFGQLTDTLKTMQGAVRAEMIKNIAIAVALLTASVIALTFIDPKKLAISLGSIAAMLGMLVGALWALGKVQSEMNMALIAVSILMISAAMLNLAAAVAILGNLDMKTLAKGLGAMTIALGILVGAMFAFSKISGSIEGFAGSMLILAFAMNILAGAVLAFGLMDMGTLAKGLGAMAIGLGLLVGAMLGMDAMKGSVEGLAASLLIMSTAMVILSVAVAAFGNMDFGTLAKGFGAMALGLGIMVGALLLLSGNSAGVLAAAGAMVLMATAMNMLVSVILILGAAPWQTVAIGIGFVALALGVLLAAGAAAMFVGPGLITLGIAVGMLGAAMALAGVGMLAFGTGFAILVAAGVGGTAVIVAAIQAFMAMLPSIAVQVGAAFVAFIKVIANASPKIRKAMGEILRNMLGTVSDAIPEIRKLINVLLDNAINVVETNIPKFVDAGFKIINKFLESAEREVPKITRSAIQLMTKFITEIGNQYPKLADAAAKTIVKFVQGTADAINNNADDLRAAGKDLAFAIADGLSGGLLSTGMEKVRSAAQQIADALPNWMKKVLGIASPSKVTTKIGREVARGLAKGITDNIRLAVMAAVSMANAVIAAGDAAVARAQTKASDAQKKADRADAKADVTDKRAAAARKAAQDYAKAHPKAAEAIRKRDRAAKKLENLAKRQRKASNSAQAAADKADQNVVDVRTFEAADLIGKGDIRQDEAVVMADRAHKMLAKANAEMAEARRLAKINKKASLAMIKQAQKDAKTARELAKQAQTKNKQANEFYAQEVEARVKQLQDDAAFEAADDKGKAAILEARAAANEAKALAAKNSAEALIEAAQAATESDAAEALRLVQAAEAAAQTAKDAADQARQEREEAQNLLNPNGTGMSTPGPSITPSRSILEDAARAVDRYTTSLRQAEELASATSGPVQFIQNNTSPESLSVSTIYRQSRNLIAAAELKMGAN